MCIFTTSYPCPEPNVDELLHRLKNTRKVSPCATVRSNDGRPASCTSEVRVQHHHLGQSEFCSWCSLTAKVKYTEMKDGTQLKRKAGSVVSDEERGESSEGSTIKKIKTGARGEAREAELKTGKHHVVRQDILSQDEAVRKSNQTYLLSITKEILDTEDVTEEPIVGLGISTNSEAALGQPTKPVGDIAKVISEAGKHCEEIAVNAPSLELATKLSDVVRMANEAGDLDEDGTQVENTSNRASAVRKEKAKLTGSPKATLAKVSMSKAPGIEDKMMPEHGEVQSIFEKINQDLINVAKGYAEVLKQNTALLQQLSEYKDEINGLNTALLQQNAQNLAEANKKKDVVKDVEWQKATMKLEKQDLEVKVRILIQKIDELTKAASAANEETNGVKARIRGQQNRVAELEGQITIMKQVEDGREKQLDETLCHNEVLQRQNAGLKVKNAKSESEVSGLRREMATIGAENSQLRAAVVEMVLSTPVPPGTPTAAGSPAAKGEDVKME